MTYADDTDDLVLFANTPTQAEFLLDSLEPATRGTGPYVNPNKTEYIYCFKQNGTISTLSGKPLKLVDQFPYLDSNISFTENYVNIRLTSYWLYGDLIYPVK